MVKCYVITWIIWIKNIIRSGCSFPNGRARRININATQILRWYVEDQISMNFHVISTYFLDVISMVQNFTLFPRTVLGVTLMVQKSKLFPRIFFGVIFLVEISTLFPRIFFNVILMVEKSTLFSRSFLDEFLTGRNLTLLLVRLQANENIRGGFPLLVTLKSWLLQDFSP